MRTTRVLTEASRLPDAWLTVEGGARIVIPAAFGNHFRVRLTSDAVLEPPHEPHSGQMILLRIEQDTTGGWTLTPNSAGITTRGSLILNTAASAVSVWMLLWDDEAAMWDAVGVPDLAAVYQPLNASLTSLSGITVTSAGLALLDDASAAAQRTTLGLGTMAVQNAVNVAIGGGAITGITDLAVADGGTGASDASGARTNLGLGTIATTAIVAAQADSTATTVADLKADFNALLAKMRTSGALAT